MSERRSSTSLITVGIVVLVVGVLSAVGLWYSAGQRYDDAVRNLARAPVGCVTTLDFAETGSYLLFVETRGTIADVVGDCGATGDFEWTADDDPSVDVTLIDPRDATVQFGAADGVTYDAAGSTGRAVQSFRVDTAGDHLLTVADADPGFAIAVGRDPNDGVMLLRIGAALAAIAGLVIGGAMLVLASRRSSAAPPTPTGWLPGPPGGVGGAPGQPVWRPVAEPPTSPPTAPPVPGQPPLGGPPVVPTAPPGGPQGPPIAAPPGPDRGAPEHRPDDPPRWGDGAGTGDGSPWAPPDDRQ